MSRRTFKIVSRPNSETQQLLTKLLGVISNKTLLNETSLDEILGMIREHCIILASNEAHWVDRLAAQLIGMSPYEFKKCRWKKHGKRRTGPIPPRRKDRTNEEE